MHIMFTAVAGFFALLSTAFCYIAFTNAERAQESRIAADRAAGKLNAMAGRLIALEGAHDSLRLQHQKLAGKFHAAQRELEEHSETPASPVVGPAPAGLRSPAPPYCDNWLTGQREGPHSEAARCVCDYCCEMRDRRERTKAQLLPAARAATLAESRK